MRFFVRKKLVLVTCHWDVAFSKSCDGPLALRRFFWLDFTILRNDRGQPFGFTSLICGFEFAVVGAP